MFDDSFRTPVAVRMGVTSAARVASEMLWTFKRLRFDLMVGIGGGVPSEEDDIWLDDVVVSIPLGRSRGVIQYDFRKTVEGGRFERKGLLNWPLTCSCAPDKLASEIHDGSICQRWP